MSWLCLPILYRGTFIFGVLDANEGCAQEYMEKGERETYAVDLTTAVAIFDEGK